MFDDTHDGEKHAGKAMVKFINGEVEIIMECDQCGRFSVGPFGAEHTRSIGQMLDQAGKTLGIPAGRMIDARSMTGNDPSIMAKGERQFEAMNLEEGRALLESGTEADADPIDNPWSRKRSA